MASPALSTVPSLAPELATPVRRPDRGARAAEEFEAHLLASLLESLEKTFGSVPGANTDSGSDDYGYLGAQALASALASAGGFGIAELIRQSLGSHEGKG